MTAGSRCQLTQLTRISTAIETRKWVSFGLDRFFYHFVFFLWRS
jgi:hypothetical protein